MYLTREEERMLQGEYGPAVEKAMRVLVKTCECMGGERLTRVTHAHVSGVSYLTIGEPGRTLIRELAEMGARARVFSTINPTGIDVEKWELMGIPRDFAEKQLDITRAFSKMGFTESMTCTPYFLRPPCEEESLAWGESSAVGMANSYYGAKTNREGGPMALMSAITGRTCFCGLHLTENRRPTVRIVLDDQVRARLGDPVIAGLLGYLVGVKVGSGVPYVDLGENPSFDSIKSYTAAAGASGSIAMSFIKGVTPGYKKAVREKLERIHVGWDEMRDLLSEQDYSSPDLLYVGCPHASLEEIIHVWRTLKESGEASFEVWVSTSRKIYSDAERMGLVEKLESLGALVIRDTCPIVTPAVRRFKHVVTTSWKAYFYLPRMHGIEVSVVENRNLGEVLCRKR